MTNFKFLLIGVLMLVCNVALAQNVTVTGRITDKATNEPLIGVTVFDERDVTKGTVTDVNGNYSISVKADATLKFTYIGYTAVEALVGDRTRIDLQMEESTREIDEVVVVGISMRRADLTGAVGSVTSDKLQEKPAATINTALQGRASGVYVSNNPTPGSDASIRIRGNNSISYGTDPIYVVDGIVMSSGFSSINVNDVATIDILKDASATALYGSRGANGVVVITTKKGKKGGKVSYDGWFGWESFSYEIPRMNAKETYDLRVDAFANLYMDQNPGADRQQYITDITTRGNAAAIFEEYEFDAIAQGKSYDWLEEVTRGGLQQNHSISFSGGSDNGNYFVSFGYYDQEGMIKNSNNTRYTGRINLEQQIKPWMKIGTNSSFSRSKTGLVQNSVFGQSFGANPMYEPNDKDVYMMWGSSSQSSAHNPIKTLTMDDDRYQNRINSTNYINITPIQELNFRAAYSLDYRNQTQYTYIPQDIGQSLQNSLDGRATHQKNEWLNWQWDVSATYTKTFAQKHRLSAYVAFNASENNSEWNSVQADGFPSDDFSYYYLNAATKKADFVLESDFQTNTIVAFLQRVNYSYANKYYATLTLRQEGSSRIAEEHRWGLFPAVALRWTISEESFLKNSGIFDQLNLRAGYGIVGNQNIPMYAYMSLYRPSVSGTTVSYRSDGRLGNPDIRWEQQKQLNIGLDVTTLNNRLSLSADYFHINNDDLLMQRTLSTLTGFNNTIANVGAMTNKGFEFTVNARIIDRNDFRWNVSGNISFTKNKITKLFGDVKAIYSYGGYTNSEIQRTGNLFVGESINSIYVWEYDKIAQQSDMDKISQMNLAGRTVRPGDIMVVDTDKNDVINDEDRYVVGNTDPKFYGGFSTDIKYKGIGLNAIFTYSQGLKRISSRYEGMINSSGLSVAHTDMLNRWTPQNTNTNIPRAYAASGRFGFGEVDWGVQDASFLRLSVLTLSYDLPMQWISKIKVSNAQIYLTGNNVFCATKYKGFDPEGGDNYPTSRMFVTGIRFDF